MDPEHIQCNPQAGHLLWARQRPQWAVGDRSPVSWRRWRGMCPDGSSVERLGWIWKMRGANIAHDTWSIFERREWERQDKLAFSDHGELWMPHQRIIYSFIWKIFTEHPLDDRYHSRHQGNSSEKKKKQTKFLLLKKVFSSGEDRQNFLKL